MRSPRRMASNDNQPPSESYPRYHKKDLQYVEFDRKLWRQLKPDDSNQIRRVCDDSIGRYFGSGEGDGS